MAGKKSYSLVLFFLFVIHEGNAASLRKRTHQKRTQRQLSRTRSEESPSSRRRLEWLQFHDTKPLLLVAAAAIFNTVSSQPFRRAVFVWRHAGPIVAHYRWTQFSLAITHADRSQRDEAYTKLHKRYAQPSLDIALNLKGLYVKIGQVLSARPDFMPVEYTSLLSTLQDSVPPWPIEQVKHIVSDSLQKEHGLAFHDVFVEMDAEALGSASIGQVHRAILHEHWQQRYGGSQHVAVKVMHPASQRQFQHDFTVFRWLCRVALPGWKQLLTELERQLMTEFDYTNEALSLQEVRRNLLQSKRFRRNIVIPEPHVSLTTRHVLIMELLRGKRFADSIQTQLASLLGSAVKAEALMASRKKEIMGITGHEESVVASAGPLTKLRLLVLQKSIAYYVKLLVDFHGKQIYLDGVWNGDPHPGNCLILEDGRLGLIDYGQTKRMKGRDERLAMARVVVALGENADNEAVAHAMLGAGFRLKDNSDRETLKKYAVLFFDSDSDAQRLGYPTPQQYFANLMLSNPLVLVPDSAVFIARTSFLFRGMGSAVGRPINTAKHWHKYALKALKEDNDIDS